MNNEITNFLFRKPEKQDAAEIYALLQPYKPYVGTSPLYTYLMICEYFCDTSVVVINDHHEIIGFMSGFLAPTKQQTLFIWEIAVKNGYHGNNLYIRMAKELYARNKPRYIELTVNPSNTQSIKRINQLAEIFSCPCKVIPLFPSEYFGDCKHEDEVLYRVGAIGEI